MISDLEKISTPEFRQNHLCLEHLVDEESRLILLAETHQHIAARLELIAALPRLKEHKKITGLALELRGAIGSVEVLRQ